MPKDYVLALKANHPTLYGVKDWFEQAIAQGFEGVNFQRESGKGHHRTEKRQVWCVPVSQPPLYQMMIG